MGQFAVATFRPFAGHERDGHPQEAERRIGETDQLLVLPGIVVDPAPTHERLRGCGILW